MAEDKKDAPAQKDGEKKQGATGEKKETPLSAEEKEAREYGALCYFPVALINIIAIVLVIFQKKGGKFARFHAFQSIALYILLIVWSMGLNILVMVLVFGSLLTGSAAAFFGSFLLMFLLIFIGVLVPMLGFLAVAVQVWSGKDVRLPYIAKFVDKYV